MPIVAIIVIAILLLLVWPMLSRPSGESAEKPVAVDEGLMRELGYIIDTDNRWIHPGIKVWVPKPHAMAECDHSELKAFHNREIWANIQKPDQPYLSPDVGRAVREHHLQWHGWLDVWFLPNGAGLMTEEIERIGAHGLNALIDRYVSFHKENHRRKQAGCLGMFLMFFWLVGGWQWGTTAWLLGMGAIAVGSWLFRPITEPPNLWDGVEEVNTQEYLQRGAEMLGEGWDEFARITAAIPIDSDHLHMMNLDRTISVDALQRNFTPKGFLDILKWMVPMDENLRY